MQTVRIEIGTGEITKLAKLELYYSGEALKDIVDNKEAAANTQAGDDKDDILTHYLHDAETVISGLFGDIKTIKLGDNPYVEFFVPDNFDTSQITPITELLKSYLVNMITARWLAATYPERAKYYFDLSGNYRTEIKVRLTRRVRPVVKPVFPMGF